MYPLRQIEACLCCGNGTLSYRQVLWPQLIAEWGLNPDEVQYIDRQQGLTCDQCGSSLRSMALAMAVMRCHGFNGIFQQFVTSEQARSLRLLEINEAGHLTQFLRHIPGHVLGEYPEVDMLRLPYTDGTFDLVVHSDTLEHVPEPVAALAECRRVLKSGGVCAYTIPIIVGRLTRSRKGLPPSFHGDPDTTAGDYLVRTEYGADAWRHPVAAGFDEIRIFTPEHPAAHALAAIKRP